MNELHPLPWRLEWERAPMIIDANGRVVATFSTGTLDGPYKSYDIVATMQFIVNAANSSILKPAENK